MRYEERVVAFIDILGFKSLLDETVDKGKDQEDNIDRIINAYKLIKNILHTDPFLVKNGLNTSKKVSIFSDSIVISFKLNEPSAVFDTLLSIKYLVMSLVSESILCRGAVTYGKFIHTDDYLFGPALVEAYILESKAALYPRIVLDRTIIDIGEKNGAKHNPTDSERKYIESLLERDSDGMYYIDYFYKAHSELNEPYDFPQYINTLSNIIRKGLMASSHHSKVDLRVKYSWMRERYNNMVDIVKGGQAMNQSYGISDQELDEFYYELKQISPNKYKHNWNK